MKPLLVIVPDKLSVLISKGEITSRYYNPGNLFDEVHILMTNTDKPNPVNLQRAVGTAKLYLHNLPLTKKDFLRSLALRPSALKQWAEPAVHLAEQIKPCFIRCHGDSVNLILAHEIKSRLNIPYAASIHTTRDDKIPGNRLNFKKIFDFWILGSVRKVGLRSADVVLPVYQSAARFPKRLGVQNIRVAYNVVNPDYKSKKTNYKLHLPVRVVYVGRINKNKNPEHIISAIKEIPNCKLDVIGDGPERQRLIDFAIRLKLDEKVTFTRAVPNAELCERLPEFDIFAIQTNHDEIPKTLMEAMLAGLPSVINERNGKIASELAGDHVLSVKNSPEGYYNALVKLISNDQERQNLGIQGRKFALDYWFPEVTEARFVSIYSQIMLKISNCF